MYIEYETQYDYEQELYRLSGGKIETFKVVKIDYTYTIKKELCSGKVVDENKTGYVIKCTSNNQIADEKLSQNAVRDKFFTSKVELLKSIADQL